MIAARHDNTYDHHRGARPLLRQTGRWRSGLFFTINLAIFAAGCAFWEYLSTGRWGVRGWDGFVRSVRTPLGEGFTHPIDVFSHPSMIPVFGLVLAMLVCVPILTAVLYRLRSAVPFAALVLVLASAPALSLVIVLGCLLAARTKLRSDMPFLAVVLGLLPVGAYLVLAPFMDRNLATLLPLQRWVLYGPLLICFVSAVLASAVALALVRVTRFRPGAVWPVAAVLLAAPAVLFYLRVGQAEVDYAIIVKPLAAGDMVFRSSDPDSWSERLDTRGLDEQKRNAKVRRAVEHDLGRRNRSLASACEEFLMRYPRSPRAPEILWVRAQCASLRLDERAYRDGRARHTARFVSPDSRDLWHRLATEYAGAPQAALAQWRLAELALRSGRVAEADDLLEAAAEQLRVLTDRRPESDRARGLAGMFIPSKTVPGHAHYANALFEVERLTWLIRQNRLRDDDASAEAMAAMMNLDPDATDYCKRIEALLDSHSATNYEKTRIGDNLRLAVALHTPDKIQRTRMLVYLAKELTDAAIEANYELGKLVNREPFLEVDPEIDTPAAYFKLVVQAPPSPWTPLAKQRLAFLQSTTRPNRRRDRQTCFCSCRTAGPSDRLFSS